MFVFCWLVSDDLFFILSRFLYINFSLSGFSGISFFARICRSLLSLTKTSYTDPNTNNWIYPERNSFEERYKRFIFFSIIISTVVAIVFLCFIFEIYKTEEKFVKNQMRWRINTILEIVIVLDCICVLWLF